MKKIFYTILSAGLLSVAVGCDDFLETTSPSITTQEDVFSNPETARSALKGVYEQWRATSNSHNFGAGAFYATDLAGSDIERHPEKYSSQTPRHHVESLYEGGTVASTYDIDYKDATGAWTNLYKTIGLANNCINSFEKSAEFEGYMSAGAPSDLSQMYGEAIAMRAVCYLELIRYYGDVPYQTMAGVSATSLTPRDSIYEVELENLKRVEPLMYRLGEKADLTKIYMTRSFVQGLIGRMALHAGGYSTRRTDLGADFYKDKDGNTITFEQKGAESNHAVYTRRTDYRKFYEVAKQYLSALIQNPGSTVRFLTTDPRSAGTNGQQFGNPFQYFYQELMNLTSEATESIYQIPMSRGTSNERPYSSGRTSSGGSKFAYPCKAYGQGRLHPTYYYGDFDPKDMRRDVTVCVTGSDGNGFEVLVPFAPGNVSKGGGLAMAKFDENRMPVPWTASQRNSGIHSPYMHLSDMMLLLAEVYAELGEDGSARGLLKQVRERAFANAADADVDGFVTKCGSLKNAILEERKFELGGEGYRRMDMIRTGTLPEAVTKVKQRLTAMVNGLETTGRYEFENGNVISNYVWTKKADAKAKYGYRLTTQAPNTSDPVLYPGWRGQNDDWQKWATADAQGKTLYSGNSGTNLGIKGLFETYLPENVTVEYTCKLVGSETEPRKETVVKNNLTMKQLYDLFHEKLDEKYTSMKVMDDEGYEATPWGADIVDNKDEYTTNVFRNYYASKAPIYFYPMSRNTISLSKGRISNGYGFAQE